MKIKIIFLLLFLSSSLLTNGCVPEYRYSTNIYEHNVNPTSEFEVIWSRGGIYTIQLASSKLMDANSELVCFIGAMKNDGQSESINCLNPLNGELLWQKSNNTSANILIYKDGVYVDSNGMPGVEKYDLNGMLLWTQRLKGTGVVNLYIFDGNLQVLVVPKKLVELNLSDGSIAQELSEGFKAFIKTDRETIIYEDGVKFLSTDMKNVIWHNNQLDRSLWMAPVLLSDTILLRTGKVRGSVYALDRKTGTMLWKTSDNIISNIAYSETKKTIYLLTLEGSLIAVNQISGEEKHLAQFTSTPFILNGEQQVGSYDLAFDDSLNMLFLILGDSRQLIAFQEKQ